MLEKTLLDEYLSEAEQLTDMLLADAGKLVDASRSGEQRGLASTDLIKRIFSSVHSLKGLSGMMGLEQVQTLAHGLENVLDEVRHGKLSLDRQFSEKLLETAEAFSILLGASARGAVTPDELEQFRKQLAVLVKWPRPGRRNAASALQSLSIRPSERAHFSPYEETRVAENLRAGRSIYQIGVNIGVAELDQQFRALTSSLSQSGELVTTLPVQEQQRDGVGLKLIFATEMSAADVESLVASYSGSVTKINEPASSRGKQALAKPRRSRKPARPTHVEVSPAESTDPEALGPKPEDISVPVSTQPEDNVSLVSLLPPEAAQEALQPLSNSVTVQLSHIDEISGLAHELSIEAERLSEMARQIMGVKGATPRERFDLKQTSRRIERRFLELEERLVDLRMISLSRTFTRAARLAGQLANDLGKSVQVEISGRSTLLDKTIVDHLTGPLFHLLRNAIDHGIETADERIRQGKPEGGRIKLEARIEGTRAIISIDDDGRGVDVDEVLARAVEIGAVPPGEQLTQEEILRLIFLPGFSTADAVSEVSGRGVGLETVERAVRELGGEISLSSQKGKGSQFRIAVPTTQMMISAFIIRVGELQYAINAAQIVELMRVPASKIIGLDGKRRIKWRGDPIPLLELRFLLGLGGARRLSVAHTEQKGASRGVAVDDRNGFRNATSSNGSSTEGKVAALVTRIADRHVAIAVEEFQDQREIIVKSLGLMAKRFRGVTGAVELELGKVALVLDLPGLVMLRSFRA